MFTSHETDEEKALVLILCGVDLTGCVRSGAINVNSIVDASIILHYF